MLRTLIWLAAALPFVVGAAFAQASEEEAVAPPSTLAELEARIAALVGDGDSAPGVVAALVDADGILWAQGFGYADRASRTPATPESRFRAGSISKSITGLLTMRLVLRLDRPDDMGLSATGCWELI